MKPSSTPRTIVFAAALVPIAVLGLAACGSNEPHNGGTKQTQDAETTAFDWDVAFATCMRGQGIDYPDPEKGGGVSQIKVDDEAAFGAAQKKCQTDIEKERGVRPVSESQRKKLDGYNKDNAETVDCLRKKGNEVEVFDGGFRPKGGTIPEADIEACSKTGSDERLDVGR